MNLKQLINKSVYGTIGYISSQDDINLLEQYIKHNLSVLKEFKQIIVATNYKDNELASANSELWTKYFPSCTCLDSKINRGHNFGTADLDNMVFDYCKINNEEWLCKASNDIILNESVLDKEIDEADFYYMNGIGYRGIADCNFDFDTVIKDNFFPQTNFYFINMPKCDYLNNKEYLDTTYEQTKSFPNYNNKIWEYIPGWSCERFLLQCVERNKLTIFHLVPEDKYRILLKTIQELTIHDPSHKNIMIDGVCHLQNPEQNIIEI
jgi:hypothetical protein